MAKYKFVGELFFEAKDMADALASLGEHFLKLSRGEVSHLLDEGSSSAMGEPEYDATLDKIQIVDFAALEAEFEAEQKVVTNG